ncbi:hypothetical protein [Sinomonas sp.]|uniref:hypothetical protein n=1 Tax=Sinomonas sp. TaxID=1914986 RepID=UPI002FE2AF8C
MTAAPTAPPRRSDPAVSLVGGFLGCVGAVLLTARALGWALVSGAAPAAQGRLATLSPGLVELFGPAGALAGAGSALCMLFFLALVRLAGTAGTFAGLAAVLGAALVLALWLAEATALAVLPAAGEARAGAAAAVAACFPAAFSLVPGPILFAGISRAGAAALGPALSRTALAIAVLLPAIAAVPGAAAGNVLAPAALGAWSLAAGIAVLRRARVRVGAG